MHMLKHRSCFHFLPLLFPSALKATMKFLCATVWEKPQKCLGAEPGDVMDSWVRALQESPALWDGIAPGFHGRAHKQEETLRESRYFTALAHYKHPEPGKEAALDTQVNPQSRHRSSYHTELLLLRTALFRTYNGVFALSFSAFSIQIFFYYELYRKAISGLLNSFFLLDFFLYIFQMFRESWRLMHFHSMRSMDQGMDGACWSVVNYW